MIRQIKRNLHKIITILLVVGYSLHTSSCASTKAAPSGGPKDTIPPVVVAAKPLENSVNFPLEEGEIYITFNEYVQLKDAFKNILLSPPQKKAVKTRIKGKGFVVTFPEPLDTNQTYSLNFGNAIVDNNESNPLYGYAYSFSTGDTVDSLMFSGKVVDAETLFPIENATVALYLNAKDSTVMNELPKAVAKTDKWGYFTIRNIKAAAYDIFAFTDDNNNN
ncbi:MAG: Ig-like domain-containing protein, partial [Bacteroidales bacterium]|nr:Ig-like domain-containing protein [Bacteroidales bacterium]